MSLDVLKLVLLLAGLVRYGAPDAWDIAWQVRLSVALPITSGALELAWDPVPIYYRPLPEYLCGQFWGVVVVDPRAPDKGCKDTLAHELAHAWQFRAFGLLLPISYALSHSVWEPVWPWEGPGDMPNPSGLNYPLLRVWWPVDIRW